MNYFPCLLPTRAVAAAFLACPGVVMVTDGEPGAGAQALSRGTAAAAETVP